MPENTDIVPPAIRARLYPTLLALGALLGAQGLITDTKWSLVVALVVALVGTGTATNYRPTEAGVVKIQNAAIAAFLTRQLTGDDDPGANVPEQPAPDGMNPHLGE